MKLKTVLSPNTSQGRIRPVLLGLAVLTVGLLAEKWWWQLGALILIVVFVQALVRYVTLD